MTMHDVLRHQELVHRPEDLVARILAVGTVTVCLLALGFVIAGATGGGKPLGELDSAQVLNYSE